MIHVEPNLPLPPEFGAVLLAVGTLVLLLIGYEAYRYAQENDG